MRRVLVIVNLNDKASFLNSLENLISHQRSDASIVSQAFTPKWQDYIENSEIIEEFIIKALGWDVNEEDISVSEFT